MAQDKPLRRMTLAELLIHVEKYSQEVKEQTRVHFVPVVNELRELARPYRRQSVYPTRQVVQRTFERYAEEFEDLKRMSNTLLEGLQRIHELAKS